MKLFTEFSSFFSDFFSYKLYNWKRLEYDDKKVDLNTFDKLFYVYNNGSFELTSLYNGESFIEELLNNSLSYNQLKNSNLIFKYNFIKIDFKSMV